MWPAPKQETATKPASPMPSVVSAPPPPPVIMPAPSPGQAQAAQAPVVEVPRPAPAPNAVAVQTLPPQPQQEAMVPPPAASSDTRIVARTNSWIELRGPAGDVLTQTYVRAGESYVVPAGIAYRLIDAR
jgi:cytoskeleton protein RodZ